MHKMGTILLTLLIILTVCLSGICQSKSDRELANLVGAVKTVSELTFRYAGSKSEPGDTVTYDSSGHETERIMISDFGEPIGKRIQTFDSSGLLQKSVFFDVKGSVLEEVIYSYSAGKLVYISMYDGKGTLRQKTARSYDERGNLAEEAYLDPNIVRAKTVFRYDQDGNAVEIAFFLASGEKASAPVGPCLGAHRVTYTYDPQGRPTTKIVYETNGSEKKRWNFTYDERGNYLVYRITSGSSVSTILYSYEYDKTGNWLKKTSVSETEDNLLELMLKATGKQVTSEQLREMKDKAKISQVTERKIIYY